MGTRENSIATWCKRFQIDLLKLRDRMKSGELAVYERELMAKSTSRPLPWSSLKS